MASPQEPHWLGSPQGQGGVPNQRGPQEMPLEHSWMVMRTRLESFAQTFQALWGIQSSAPPCCFAAKATIWEEQMGDTPMQLYLQNKEPYSNTT